MILFALIAVALTCALTAAKLNVYAKGDDLILVDEDNASECAAFKAKGYKDSDITPDEFRAIKFAHADKRKEVEAEVRAAVKQRREIAEKEAARVKAEADRAAAEAAKAAGAKTNPQS